jgi:hypothetical protein
MAAYEKHNKLMAEAMEGNGELMIPCKYEAVTVSFYSCGMKKDIWNWKPFAKCG